MSLFSAGSTCALGSTSSPLTMICTDQRLYQPSVQDSHAVNASRQNSHPQLPYQSNLEQHQFPNMPYRVPNVHQISNHDSAQPQSGLMSNINMEWGTGERNRTRAIHLQQLHGWQQNVLPDRKFAKLARIQVVSQVGCSLYFFLVASSYFIYVSTLLGRLSTRSRMRV